MSKATPHSRLSRASPALYALFIYLVLVGLAAVAGYRMTIPTAAFQLLDVHWLRDRLGESLLNLHAQPPLLNFGLGVALKLAATLAFRVETILLVGHVILGGFAVVALAGLAQELFGLGPRTYVALTIVLVNPFFYASLFQYFYTFHEWCLLVGLGFFSLRFLKTGQTRALACALALVVLLENLHSLFHVAWAFTLVLALLLLAPRPAETGRTNSQRARRRALCASAALLASLAWPVKNFVKFGFFGSSSWIGMNFAHGLADVSPGLMAPFLGLPSIPEVERELASLVPAGSRTVPALATLRKSDGSMNWNHFAILSLSREMAARAVRRVRTQPSSLVVKAARNYIRGYAIYEARHPYAGTLEPVAIGPVSRASLRAYEILFFQYLGENTAAEPFSGFAFVFPILLAVSAAQIARRRRERREEAIAVASLLFTVAWVLAMVLFVDGREGNRMRFSTEPFLVIAVVWAYGVPARRPVPDLERST